MTTTRLRITFGTSILNEKQNENNKSQDTLETFPNLNCKSVPNIGTMDALILTLYM